MTRSLDKALNYADRVPASGFRNKIINGDFLIWQRATSSTFAGYGADDRWNNSHVGTTKTVSLQVFPLGQTSVPGNPVNFSRTVVSSVAGAGNYCVKTQRIEYVSTLAGRLVTITFWAKADANRNIATEFVQNFGTIGSPSPTVTGIGVKTHSLTTSWQKFSYTTTINSISGSTLGSGNNDYLEFYFWFDGGSNFNSRNNSLGQQSGTFDISHVSIVDGDATLESDPFSPRSQSQEVNLCLRYYEQGVGYIGGYADSASRNCYTWIPFAAKKRAIPTLTYATAGNVNVTTYDARNATSGGINWFCSATAAGGFSWNGTWTADAEL